MSWSRCDLAAEPLDLLEDAPVARGLGVLEVLGQQVEVQAHRRERVADLVGQAAGELGDLGVLGAEPAVDLVLVDRSRTVRRVGGPAESAVPGVGFGDEVGHGRGPPIGIESGDGSAGES